MSCKMKPFLKWVGGKTQLLPELYTHMPGDLSSITTYVEPFVGAGAFFLALIQDDLFSHYIINDINEDLINLYLCIRDNLGELVYWLNDITMEYLKLKTLSEQELYYRRNKKLFNRRTADNVHQAALFVFLNKTCFNGLYRVNNQNKFNVAFGQHSNVTLYNYKQLNQISTFLNLKDTEGNSKVTILCGDYTKLDSCITNKTFVYFDPPYRPITDNGFNSYSKDAFDDSAQIALAEFYHKMSDKGALLLLSNSDLNSINEKDHFINDLYCDFNIHYVNATRAVNSNGNDRGYVSELLITNY